MKPGAQQRKEVGKVHSNTMYGIVAKKSPWWMGGLPYQVCEKVFSLMYLFLFLVLLFISRRQYVFLLFSWSFWPFLGWRYVWLLIYVFLFNHFSTEKPRTQPKSLVALPFFCYCVEDQSRAYVVDCGMRTCILVKKSEFLVTFLYCIFWLDMTHSLSFKN